ncbi:MULTISPECIES: transposase [unclassified Microcoleus]|uniref:RNA-guided endonuclease InsQ/TnpB family protein n=1 Tax=unclassified Microcoleus TaxID=2642155 RepID=UPI001D98C96C|nr:MULTISPECIES: transposase [unclassified Microcoleus]MCC3505598.1 transposase [Microcoleus sp. PH2017_19_SFW_U_A]TAE15355.1 MAG: transposase [Oscillatoriales cyanobacterium]MCC3489865.1 transposase [Microcoleus sp. PH2017_16_JOR_D_A]MCC3525595.1 transposase [Microcoleus sp. PH2017_20_SFW_D_A]MCC3534030.1 transposase [Microcoleus sp. PH2017_25_DOB_D_A]
MYRAVKMRIYPTGKQESYLAQCFGNTRWLWNHMLNATTTAYKETGKGLSKAAMDKLLPGLKKEFEWLGLAYSQVLQRVTFNLSSAFVNFFEGRAKFPNFKSKHGKESIQYPQNIKLMPEDSVIKFPGNLGLMKTVFHKQLPDAKFTTVTISRNADGRYYASILFNQNDNPVVAIREAIGVDLGLKHFAITSEGSKYDLPKKQLAKLENNKKCKQKKLAKKTDKTSNKRRKARRILAKVSSKIARIREDFLHKLSRKIAYENQVICVEDLAVKNMVKNPNLAKSISDQGWGMFQTMLKYKAEKFGHTYQEIGRFFPSSQLCSETLLPIPMLQKGYDSLGVRFVDCPHCQKQHDRDINAAINIKNEGLRLLELGTSSSALGGDVRPKLSGRKKAMKTEAIPNELGSLHPICAQMGVG